MQVIYSGKDNGLKKAAAFVNELITDGDLWDRIIAHGKFDRALIDPNTIVDRLKAGPTELHVQDLKAPRWKRWTIYRRTVAVVDPTHPARFSYHRKFRRNSVGQKVNTILHEYVHIVDNSDADEGEQMGHGDNSSVGKENTAPYWIGSEAQRIYETKSGEMAAAPPAGEM